MFTSAYMKISYKTEVWENDKRYTFIAQILPVEFLLGFAVYPA
jgi:hypothetical protein